MTRKVNTELLNARMREKEDIVQLGKQLANYESNGISIESAKSNAKKALGLSEDSILLIDADEAMTSIRKSTQNFVAFVNAINTAKKSGAVSENDLKPLEGVVSKLESELASVYEIEDIEDLYEEVE